MYIILKIIKHDPIFQLKNLEFLKETKNIDNYNHQELEERGFCFVWQKVFDGVTKASHVIINMAYDDTNIPIVKRRSDIKSLIREIKIHLLLE